MDLGARFFISLLQRRGGGGGPYSSSHADGGTQGAASGRKGSRHPLGTLVVDDKPSRDLRDLFHRLYCQFAVRDFQDTERFIGWWQSLWSVSPTLGSNPLRSCSFLMGTGRHIQGVSIFLPPLAFCQRHLMEYQISTAPTHRASLAPLSGGKPLEGGLGFESPDSFHFFRVENQPRFSLYRQNRDRPGNIVDFQTGAIN